MRSVELDMEYQLTEAFVSGEEQFELELIPAANQDSMILDFVAV